MLLALPAAEKEKEKGKEKGKKKEKEKRKSSVAAKILPSQTYPLFSHIFSGINITKHLYF